MNNANVNSMKTLNSIRTYPKYSCKGDVIFKTAIQYALDYGRENLNDKEIMDGWIEAIDRKHDDAEAAGKHLWIDRDFEKAILECARDIAEVPTVDIIKYIQSNWLFYEYDDIDYMRAIELLHYVVDYVIDDSCETEVAIDKLDEIGFLVDELKALGYDELFDYVEDDYDDED